MKHYFLHILFVLGLFVTSCATPKNITYMQGLADGDIQTTVEKRITVQPGDRLSIVVSSKDPELAEIFNLAIAQYRVGYSNQSSNTTQGVSAFAVDPEGDISYPIIGKLHVEGLSRDAVAELIKNRIISDNLLKDPIVTVEFLNATVSVIGDVAHPGEYSIDKDRLTILQALSKAGDLNITGEREQVLVIREEKGRQIAYRVNLTDPQALLASPAYYLQQNDVVYVEPNDTKKRQATANGNTVLTPTFWISVASLLTTITALIIR